MKQKNTFHIKSPHPNFTLTKVIDCWDRFSLLLIHNSWTTAVDFVQITKIIDPKTCYGQYANEWGASSQHQPYWVRTLAKYSRGANNVILSLKLIYTQKNDHQIMISVNNFVFLLEGS